MPIERSWIAASVTTARGREITRMLCVRPEDHLPPWAVTRASEMKWAVMERPPKKRPFKPLTAFCAEGMPSKVI